MDLLYICDLDARTVFHREHLICCILVISVWRSYVGKLWLVEVGSVGGQYMRATIRRFINSRAQSQEYLPESVAILNLLHVIDLFI